MAPCPVQGQPWPRRRRGVQVTTTNLLPHLQLRLLAAVCSDVSATNTQVLRQAGRALAYGASDLDLELVTGHWPKAEDVRTTTERTP